MVLNKKLSFATGRNVKALSAALPRANRTRLDWRNPNQHNPAWLTLLSFHKH